MIILRGFIGVIFALLAIVIVLLLLIPVLAVVAVVSLLIAVISLPFVFFRLLRRPPKKREFIDADFEVRPK